MIIFLLITIFTIAVFMSGLIRHYAIAFNIVDIPNSRSSHKYKTPRAGGIAIVIAFYVGLSISFWLGIIEQQLFVAATGAGFLVAIIGFLDDLGHVPFVWRLFVHTCASLWALYWLGISGTLINAGYSHHLILLISIAAAIFLVWLLNMYNFMDGIDGLAASEAVFIALSGAFFSWLVGSTEVTYAFLILASASLGFLVWNWQPAKIFMGDVGSGFLGVTLGVITYSAIIRDEMNPWCWLILFSAFLTDATITLLRRITLGEVWYQAHHNHAYQKLARKWGHRHVTVAVIIINSLWLFPLAYLSLVYPNYGALLFLVAIVPLVYTAIIVKAGDTKKNRH